jgi:hypothetical protein
MAAREAPGIRRTAADPPIASRAHIADRTAPGSGQHEEPTTTEELWDTGLGALAP